MEPTEFQKLTSSGTGIKRGRPVTLTPEQRLHRKSVQKIKNRIRNEARRRAYVVLQTRYADEFTALMEQECEALKNEDRYHIPTEAEFFNKTKSESNLTI
jgi:hypothetical protein